METKKHEHKIYNSAECCVFRKTKDLYGGLSNMASGFPLKVNGYLILSTEALYQACRFPHLPNVQEKIIKEKSPMSAKMVGKPHRKDSRPDWDDARIKIMRWCLRVKLAQNFLEFGKLLESTFDKPIVEDSSKDDFWGAIRVKQDKDVLIGTNALGRLLMELRQFYNEKRYSYDLFVVEPLNISEFKLFGHIVDTIDERENFITMLKKSVKYREVEILKSWSPKEMEYPNIDSKPSSVNEGEIKKEKHELKDKILTKKTEKTKKIKTKKKKSKFERQATLPF